MIGWMVYALAAGLALGLAAYLAERALRLLGRPTRWAWLAAMLATVIWPFLAAAVLGGGAARSPAEGARLASDAVVSSALPIGPVAADPAIHGLEPWLLGGWLAGSAALLMVLLFACGVLRRERRGWRRGVVAGEPVLLSAAVGPAVIGAVRPRIVLPSRVLELAAPLQRLIVQHEREHILAGDSRLLAAGLLLLVLLPWCLPLWWHFHRLRFAIEVDCDRRLLSTGADPRAYAEALLTVARWRAAVLPLTAMAPSKATLERRIRSIVSRRPPPSVRRAVLLLAVAALLPLASGALPAPPPPSPASLLPSRGASPPASPASASVPPGVNLSMPPTGESLSPVADGSLPGDPGEERLATALTTHHPDATAGLPAGSMIWFVADRAGAVRHTGIDRGTEEEVTARIRARFPTETSDLVLAFDEVTVGTRRARVLWILPPP